jgi:hypothetical protein
MFASVSSSMRDGVDVDVEIKAMETAEGMRRCEILSR